MDFGSIVENITSTTVLAQQAARERALLDAVKTLFEAGEHDAARIVLAMMES